MPSKHFPIVIQAEINGQSFSWNIAQEWEVVQDHKISFGEAATAFSDPYALNLGPDGPDQDLSRFIGLTSVSGYRRVIVVHFYKKPTEYFIVKATLVTPEERTKYLDNINYLVGLD